MIDKMINLRLILRPLSRIGAIELIYTLMFLALLPLCEMGLVCYLSSSISLVFLLIFLAGAGLFFGLLGIALLVNNFTLIQKQEREGLFKENHYYRVLGTIFVFALLVFPGFLSTVLGLLLLPPPVRVFLGKRWVRKTGLTIKELIEYRRIYDE